MNRSSTVSRLATVAVLVLLGALSVRASAAPIALNALQALSPDSTFTLSFSGQGLPSSLISNTAYTLEVDDEPASTGAARFLSYYQQVASLTLPDGQGGYVNTGDLTVEIVPGSSGVSAFDPVTGIFTTTETYKISYTGDLRPIGLDNGGYVLFPSTSDGTVIFDSADPNSGWIQQNWTGSYDPLGLDYTCVVYTVFPEPAAAALLGLAAAVIVRRRR